MQHRAVDAETVPELHKRLLQRTEVMKTLANWTTGVLKKRCVSRVWEGVGLRGNKRVECKGISGSSSLAVGVQPSTQRKKVCWVLVRAKGMYRKECLVLSESPCTFGLGLTTLRERGALAGPGRGRRGGQHVVGLQLINEKRGCVVINQFFLLGAQK
jgi:hypothetical protein